jgi:Zn-dependent protease with chaperone function
MYFSLGLFTTLALLLTVYTLGSLMVLLAWRWLDAISARWAPRKRANFLFGFRIAPAAGAISFVVFGAWPSYVAFEPRESNETIGIKLSILAGVAAWGIAWSAFRVFRAWKEGRRVTAEWMRTAQPVFVEGVSIPVYRVAHEFPIVAVAGILRPRLFIANQLLDSMGPEEIAAAVAHEMGHVAARDNLRRALLCLCPDLRTLLGHRSLDAIWMEVSESAADLFAVRRGARSALDLASALIKVARMTPVDRPVAFPSCMQLLASASESGLAGRVQRLISLSQRQTASSEAFEAPSWSTEARTAFVVVPVICCLVGFWTSPACLHATHEVLEGFLRLLS